MINAVVLAGGPPDDVAATQHGAANKAFVRIDGITLVERTMQALRESGRVERIIAVAPLQAHGDPALAHADERRADGVKISLSLRNGLQGLPSGKPVLVVASDLPILSVRAVDDFIERALALDPDIGYGCLEKSVHMRRFPEVPHTWARLRDGTYCGGGMIAIKPRVLAQLERFIEQLGAARKNPLHLASLFGWDMVLRFALRRLTIAQAEARASHIVGAPIRAIVSPYAETAVNVDRVSDIALAERLVREK
ncbi:MAG TPA: nucleotidyltransferase family protein [Candidatus Baltobacteraceae bacterium]|jgi:GTP:adenosylcobinamide-phosphate guanylyltransferase|nr:nucleotidyltransferase family protein [Candidatus Baltobacteraceae bacterium]